MMIISFTWAVASLIFAAACETSPNASDYFIAYAKKDGERLNRRAVIAVHATATSTKTSVCFLSFVICCTTDLPPVADRQTGIGGAS